MIKKIEIIEETDEEHLKSYHSSKRSLNQKNIEKSQKSQKIVKLTEYQLEDFSSNSDSVNALRNKDHNQSGNSNISVDDSQTNWKKKIKNFNLTLEEKKTSKKISNSFNRKYKKDKNTKVINTSREKKGNDNFHSKQKSIKNKKDFLNYLSKDNQKIKKLLKDKKKSKEKNLIIYPSKNLNTTNLLFKFMKAKCKNSVKEREKIKKDNLQVIKLNKNAITFTQIINNEKKKPENNYTNN